MEPRLLPQSKLLEFRYQMSHKKNVQAFGHSGNTHFPNGSAHQNIEANYFYVLRMFKTSFSLSVAFKIIEPTSVAPAIVPF